MTGEPGAEQLAVMLTRPPNSSAVALPADALDLSPEVIAERFRWARERGHPSYVWPEIPIAVWRACLHAVERVTERVLAGRELPVELEVPAGAGARALGVAAFSAGMGPLLGYWIEGGEVMAPPEAAALLRLHLEHGRRRAAVMKGVLAGVLDLFAGCGLQATVIKGAHTGRICFPEPGTRPAGDIDLVVAPRDLETAGRVLRSAGYTPAIRQARPYKCDWTPPGALRALRSLELAHADGPFVVELHDSLDRSFYGVRTVRFGPLDAANTRPWPELHPAARVLAQPLLLGYLAVHASEELHQLQLVRLVEIVRVARADLAAGRLAWDGLEALLQRLGTARFAYPALQLAERLAPGTINAALLERLGRAAAPAMRRVLDRLTPATAQRPERLSLDERFMWAAGPLELARRAAYLLWPTRAASSRRPLRAVYAERLFRMVRGRVSWRTPSLTREGSPDPPAGGAAPPPGSASRDLRAAARPSD